MDPKKYRFPEVCYGCYDNCYHCTRTIHSASVPVLRQLAAARTLKSQAISRMQRDIERIDEQMRTLLSK